MRKTEKKMWRSRISFRKKRDKEGKENATKRNERNPKKN